MRAIRLCTRVSTSTSEAEKRFAEIAPIIRGLLAQPTGDPDHPWARAILSAADQQKMFFDFVDSDRGREIALTPPLTSDHLIRTKPFYLWIDSPDFKNLDRLREQFSEAFRIMRRLMTPMSTGTADMPEGVERMDSLPRVILVPGLGAICAGQRYRSRAHRQGYRRTYASVKAQIAAMGTYSGMAEKDLFHMEYRSLQHSKLQGDKSLPLARQVALITGAAGAIGSGIAQELLEQGCHVAVTDLAGDAAHHARRELKSRIRGAGHGRSAGCYQPGIGRRRIRRRDPNLGRHRSGRS